MLSLDAQNLMHKLVHPFQSCTLSSTLLSDYPTPRAAQYQCRLSQCSLTSSFSNSLSPTYFLLHPVIPLYPPSSSSKFQYCSHSTDFPHTLLSSWKFFLTTWNFDNICASATLPPRIPTTRQASPSLHLLSRSGTLLIPSRRVPSPWAMAFPNCVTSGDKSF